MPVSPMVRKRPWPPPASSAALKPLMTGRYESGRPNVWAARRKGITAGITPIIHRAVTGYIVDPPFSLCQHRRHDLTLPYGGQGWVKSTSFDFPPVCPEVLTRPAMSTFFERVGAALGQKGYQVDRGLGSGGM